MLNKIKKILICSFLISAFVSTQLTFADDLDISLLGERSSKGLEVDSKKDHDYQGNYALLFNSRNAASEIISWVGVSTYKYRIDGNLSINDLDAKASAVYNLVGVYYNSSKVKVTLRVYMPHPRFEKQAKYNLFPYYNKLDPKKKDLAQKERITVQGKYPATLFEYKDKRCSVLIEMPRQVRVYANSMCKDRAVLLDFLEELSLDKFKEKIEQ